MSLYEEHILPHLINRACSTKPTRKQREKVVPLARGDVLEVGFGSGLNLPFYDPTEVRKIWGLEPAEGMRRKARRALEDTALDVEFLDLPGEEIPLDDNSVDTVLVTYTLCTITDVMSALVGMRRVLKPGGTLIYCEHGIAPDADVRRWQHRLNGAWQRFSGGCNMNRDIPALIREAGFKIDVDERMYIPGIRMLCYNYWGQASSG
jgi:ubiquinone/menaquinone biosynthesis C-methylase UbiE